MGLRTSGGWWICGLVAVSHYGCKPAGKAESTKNSALEVKPTVAPATSGERAATSAALALQSAESQAGAAPRSAVSSHPPSAGVTTAPESGSAKSGAMAAAEPRQSCDVLCRIGQSLDCGTSMEICVSRCLEMARQIPPCERQMTEALQCFAKQSEENWECDRGTGIPTLKEGPCGSEQEAVARCVQGIR